MTFMIVNLGNKLSFLLRNLALLLLSSMGISIAYTIKMMAKRT